jgi:ADP-ribose pyrophosphatase YjhB (NUDIX family)
MPHIHEKIDFVSDVFIVNNNSVLLRKHDKYKIWLPPGGHVELDEDMEEAALREVQEEVGLAVVLVGERASAFDGLEKEVLVPRFIQLMRFMSISLLFILLSRKLK